MKKEATGNFLALLTILVWGVTFVSTKVLLEAFSPLEILVFRFVLGFLALCIVYPRRMKVQDKKHELYFAIAGLSGITLYYLLENIALLYTSASNVGVITSMAPFFTAVFSYFLLKSEKLRGSFFIGFVIAVAGIAMMSFVGYGALEFHPIGDILAALSCIMWAIYAICTKKISEFSYHAVQVTRRTFAYGLIFMIPAMLLMDFSLDFSALAQPKYLANIIFLGLGASALCFATWNIAVRILGAIKTSVYIYGVPVITTAVSAVVLGEKITIWTIVGIALTIFGLLISENKIVLFASKAQMEKELRKKNIP